MQLVFFDEREQILSWTNDSSSSVPAKLIAVTAEALQALEERGLPHEPVCAYADLRQRVLAEPQYCQDCFLLAQEIESFIGQRYASARFDGPGFLSGNAYYLQFAVCILATRLNLMRETIQACRPTQTTVFPSKIDPSFSGDGYVRNPWIDALQGCFAPLAPSKKSRSDPGSERIERLDVPSLRNNRESSPPHPAHDADNRRGLRLLMAHSLAYDWNPVLAHLMTMDEVECFALDGVFPDKRDWPYYYRSVLTDLKRGAGVDLECGQPQTDPEEEEAIGHLFDAWERARSTEPELIVCGVNLYPALRIHLRSMAASAPANARHADSVAQRALDVARPDAVCFFSMPWLAAKRLAFHARQRGVPSVCYQHGGCYGTHDVPSHALTEMAHADYFLSYGNGIVSPANPCLPTRAKYVPVGSTRLESFRSRQAAPVPHSGFIVLWIGEVSLRNTYGPLEDTKRYLMQRKCLEILGHAANLRVIYRPFPGELAAQATPRWLELAKLPTIRVESNQSLANLMLTSDLIICDSTSCTAFNEGLALNKPTILYLDPTQILLLPHFIEDLERACLWCKTADALMSAVRRLAVEPENFIRELRQIDTTAFLRKYVLHEPGATSIQRVISFLINLRRHETAVEQRSPGSASPRIGGLSDALSRLNQRIR